MPTTPPTTDDAQYIERLCRFLPPALLEALEDDDITELYTNPDAQLRLMSHSRGRVHTDIHVDPRRLHMALNTVADHHEVTLGAGATQLSAELPPGPPFHGARLQAFLPPTVPEVAFNLRKPPKQIYPLSHYVDTGMLTPTFRDTICEAIETRQNLLIAGGTGTGKTTLANACLRHLSEAAPNERLVILEDTVELQTSSPDHLALRPSGAETIQDLVKATLRATPDRIIVGEVRDGAALDLLDAWQTGHPGGIATVHASSARGALERLDRLAQRNPGSRPQRDLVADTIDLVVLIEGFGPDRHISSVTRVLGLTPDDAYHLQSNHKENPS